MGQLTVSFLNLSFYPDNEKSLLAKKNSIVETADNFYLRLTSGRKNIFNFWPSFPDGRALRFRCFQRTMMFIAVVALLQPFYSGAL